MYDARDLKSQVLRAVDRAECPVRSCSTQVRRARRRFVPEPDVYCREHRLFISASTFEYDQYRDNLLLRDVYDRRLLDEILAVKREAKRLGRERSEDAFTFNVVRALERESLLEELVSEISGTNEYTPVPSYWSFSQQHHAQHPLLSKAISAFGEIEGRGSEPDLIIETSGTLFIVEAKLGSSNRTKPSRSSVLMTYKEAEGGWYRQVFRTGPDELAIKLRLYQLMRLWLLGTWMARAAGKRLVLVSLVPQSCDPDLVARFSPHIIESNTRLFRRHSWEQVRALAMRRIERPGIAQLVSYLDNKTLGYNSAGRLTLALARRSA